MKRFILAVAMCLMFISPAIASSTDIFLFCWFDGDDVDSIKETATIILKPDGETADLINPYNILQTGSLTVTTYFYVIKISSKSDSKVGELKINRLTGRFSSHWAPPGDENYSSADDHYGVCVQKPFGGNL